jgi:cyclic dehypoxanthinyl futalosine synthase
MTAVGRPAVMAPTAPTIAEQLEAAPRRFEMGRDEAILTAVVEDGKRLSASEALYLFEYGDLERIGAAADAVRRRIHPDNRATFIIDRNINYTNVCVARCSFCAFYRLPRHAEGYRRSKEEIFRRIEEALDMGATQIMFQGGHDPQLKIDYYEDLLSSVKQQYPVTLHSLGPPEVLHIAKVSRLTVPEVLRRLRQAGLDSLPGAGAEVLVERVRKAVSPFKSSSDSWLEVMEEAHRQHIRTTATMTFGMVESYAERVEHFQRIRDVQDKADPGRGFRAFIPFIYQPGNTELGGRATSIADYLRTLAISRLFLDNFYSLQGSWLTTGTTAARSSLAYGADDLGSIMLEENVVRATGLRHRMTDHSMVQLIRECGRVPALRDTHYRVIATYA